MIKASCHCGAVCLEVDAAPTEVTDSNCSICRRYGTLWAYYSSQQVHRSGGATDIYMCNEKNLKLHRCSVCGCVLYWAPRDPKLDRMGVNTRLMDHEILARAKIRRLDGADTWKYLDE